MLLSHGIDSPLSIRIRRRTCPSSRGAATCAWSLRCTYLDCSGSGQQAVPRQGSGLLRCGSWRSTGHAGVPEAAAFGQRTAIAFALLDALVTNAEVMSWSRRLILAQFASPYATAQHADASCGGQLGCSCTLPCDRKRTHSRDRNQNVLKMNLRCAVRA